MKLSLISILLTGAIVALTSFSCAKQELVETGQTTVISCNIEPDAKTSLDGTSVTWTAGDAISLFNKNSTKKVYTLVSGAGTTSAKFSGEKINDVSPFYVIYPDNSANTKANGLNFAVAQNQTYVANSFGNGSFPMYGKFASFSDPINLKNLFGGIKLQFTGDCTVSKIVLEDLDGASLWGMAKLALNDKQGTDAQTITFTNGGSSINLLCPDGVTLNKTTPTAFVFAVPAGSFKKGFEVTVFSGSTEVGTFTTTADKTITRNNIRVMESREITGAPEPTDLSATESANCYILYTAGDYKFKAVKGNSSTALTVTSVEVLWETVNTTTAPAAGAIVKKATYADGYVSFRATGTPGNALIAAKNGSTIVWSWHIWVPSSQVTKAAYSNVKVAAMMDRNLGALVTTGGDPLSNGLLYQFGRKDPFMGSASYSSNTPIASTGAFSQETISAATDIDYANAHPTTFITQDTNVQSAGDWLISGSGSNWNSSEKTVYDPCPPGYMVAPNTAWDNISDITSSTNCWTLEGIHNYPYTGRITGKDGKYDSCSNGYVWSRNSGTNQGQLLIYASDGFTPKRSFNRSVACAMRCCSNTAPVKPKTVRVLAIGNSFSTDAVEQELAPLLAAAGCNSIIGNMYIAGCPLSKHASNASSDAACYSYRKIVNGVKTTTEGVKLSEAIQDEDWDFISVQEGAGYHGFYNTTYLGTTHSMEPDLTTLVNYIISLRTNKDCKIVYHAPWVAKSDYTGEKFGYYGYDQQVMYQMIVTATKQVLAAHPEIDLFINTFDAVQNARTSFIGDNMTRDGWHLHLAQGRYTSGCIWAEKLLGTSVVGNSYHPVSISAYLAEVCQTAAHEAVQNPYTVTDLSYFPAPNE